MTRSHKQELAAALLTALLAGCAGPRMLPPSDVTALDRAYEAVERSWIFRSFSDESFRLGPYAVGAVERGETAKKSVHAGGYRKSLTITHYTYELSADSAKNPGSCRSENERHAASNAGTATSWVDTELTCECAGAQLRILGGANGLARGTLELDRKSYAVTSLSRADYPQLDGNTVGFRADGDGKLLGAVDLLYPGKVWLSGDLDEGSAAKLACLFVGATLYVPPYVPQQQD